VIDSRTMPSRSTLALTLLILAGSAAAGEVGPSNVVLVDLSEQPGAARMVLEDAADRIQARAGIPATVHGPADDGAGEASAAARRSEAHAMIQGAQTQYEVFDLEGARASLEQASLLLEALTDPEVGDLKIQIHWLQTQIAIVVGETARASSHIRIIVRVAPWWEPPVGLLTPEVKKALVDERSRVEADGVRVFAPDLPLNTVVRVDGLAVEEPAEVAIPAGRHVLRVERPGYVAEAEVMDLSPGQAVTIRAPLTPAWTDGQRASLRRALESQDEGDRSPLLDELAQATGAVLIAVGFDAGDGKVRARLYTLDPPGWLGAPLLVAAEPLAAVALAALPQVAPVTSQGPVQPLLAFDVGGGGRLVGAAQTAVSPGGGLAASFGGGVAVRQFLAIRALVAAGVHGPSPLPEETGEAGRDGTQQGYLIRIGVEVAPRIPLGKGSYLWFAGGGGFAVGGIATDLDGAEPTTLQAAGGYVSGSTGLEHTPRPGLTVGPVVGFTYAGVPLDDNLAGPGGTLRVSANSYSVLEFGLRVTIRPPA